jgi:hypothetical protein
MAGVKGLITRSLKGNRKSVYLSNLLGMFADRRRLHITSGVRGKSFHTSIGKSHGLFNILMRLYHHGLGRGR